MATISKYQTSSGVTLYCVRYRTPDRSQTDKRGFRTKRDAQAWADQLEVDKRKGAYVAPAAGRVKLGEYAREWLASKHALKPSTRSRYQVVLDTALARYADMPLGDISRQFVREWVAEPQHGDGAGLGSQDGRSAAASACHGGRRESVW